MRKKVKTGLKILAAVIFIPGFLALAAWIFMLLWNALMTQIFGLPTILFWQGVGLIVIAKLLFGNLGGRRKCKCKVRGRKKWKRKMKEKCKEQFKEQLDMHRDETGGEAITKTTDVGPS